MHTVSQYPRKMLKSEFDWTLRSSITESNDRAWCYSRPSQSSRKKTDRYENPFHEIETFRAWRAVTVSYQVRWRFPACPCFLHRLRSSCVETGTTGDDTFNGSINSSEHPLLFRSFVRLYAASLGETLTSIMLADVETRDRLLSATNVFRVLKYPLSNRIIMTNVIRA